MTHHPCPVLLRNTENLAHHYYHQRARREASTFWAGCGAVRRAAFLDLNGFDAARYRRPSIEDIELAYRIRAAGGRILLDPNLHGTHLKAWTILEVIRVDLFSRAIPWARLMMGRHELTNDLNLSTGERLRAGVAGIFFLSLLLLCFDASLWWAPAFATVAALIANKSFFAFMRARRGVPFAIQSLLFHQIYYVYSSMAFFFCLLEYCFNLAKSRKSADLQTRGPSLPLDTNSSGKIHPMKQDRNPEVGEILIDGLSRTTILTIIVNDQHPSRG